MPKKTPIQTVKINKPVRNSLRREIFDLLPGEDFTVRMPAFTEGNESSADAATRVGRKLREKYSRYVTDARQQTGKTYECNTSREWVSGSWADTGKVDKEWTNAHFNVTYQIICKG